ncbi:MAG: acetylornithine deacetylase, partial [Proteobacteria bacterium]|nr:acetylornithine deacetylase [Pseudomonadota bacterium]
MTDQISQSALALLTDLVGFNSVSSQSNLPLLEYVEKYLDAHGVWHTRVPAPEGPKSNLIARIGPEAPGGIVLSGHTDVVPVAGQPWDTDPFTLTRKGSKLYGRGTSDMKSFLAVCLAMIPHWKTLNLKRPFWLAFSYDEEVGCLGVPHLLSHMTAKLPRPAFAVIGEPTLMQVVTAHKGVLSFETTVTGLEWHS